jgi:hypothetical protein
MKGRTRQVRAESTASARVWTERPRQVIRYYGQLWTEPENLIHHGPPEKIAEELRQYRDTGIDELIVFLEIPELEQVDLFARAVEIAAVGWGNSPLPVQHRVPRGCRLVEAADGRGVGRGAQ